MISYVSFVKSILFVSHFCVLFFVLFQCDRKSTTEGNLADENENVEELMVGINL